MATRETKSTAAEDAIFELYSIGVATNRDEWSYDFSATNLERKASFFAGKYNQFLENNDTSYDPIIKWSRNLRRHFEGGRKIAFSQDKVVTLNYRPFVCKWYFGDAVMSNDLTRNHFEMFGSDLRQPNKVANFCVNRKDFYVLASDKVTDLHFTGDTQCLPLYRYTPDGERVCNITDWGLQKFNDHYRQEWGDGFEELAGPEGITAEDIFAYTYAVLHDPAYRQEYRVDLLREFPRLPFYHDFPTWKQMGQELLDLHIGFEDAEPYPLERVDTVPSTGSGRAGSGAATGSGPSTGSGRAARVILRADKERGAIILDDRTTLTGIPAEAWEYQLGSRSALEWVLDQYKERKPRDPTIAERFNTYRFADYKEQVIDLLQRVCTVSVKTVEIVGRMSDRG